ncbi:hypothetical protein BCR44DRAFT_41239 [Catenaria anguillulae PL171]|uniref:Uncharacterized protein n=1 Tax=Catenaria anguillulae PL171 TaxID=765915 RepID=A0A1Y2HX42_9FUNG|nr:hypothetical protein BCR44DRAFT_41239 [Catenaria anguillulae PL171]
MPYQRLDIHRVSRSRQVVQKDIIHGRATESYSVLRRDFVLIRNNLDQSFRVFQPFIFLNFATGPNQSHRVAYGQLYQRISEDVTTARLPRIVKSGPLCVVPIESIHSAAHAVPEFALANSPPIASDPKPPAPPPPSQPPGAAVGAAENDPSPLNEAPGASSTGPLDTDSMRQLQDVESSAAQPRKNKRKASESQSASTNGGPKKKKKTQPKSQRAADGTTYAGYQFDCWLLNIYASAEVYLFQSLPWFDYWLY